MNLVSLVRFLLLAIAVWPLPAMPQAQTGPSPAGKITTLIPVGSVLRERKVLEAKKDMSVFWLDNLKTERNGRARVRLEDGSVLNVGSQASLIVRKHDAAKQQTNLELIYGKVRADVTKIASPDGYFEIRTKVAACGVVGTEEYLDSTPVTTTVIALGGGRVKVSTLDPRFPGSAVLDPGEAITVVAGRPLPPKRVASAAELLKAVEDTEGGPGATITPGSAVPGQTLDAMVTGNGLQNTRGVSFSQTGLTVKTRGAPTASGIPVTITVDQSVPAGAYELNIDRTEGALLAPFTVTSQTTVQMSAVEAILLPPAQNLSAIRGAKIPLDASSARSPAGTQIVAYDWTVPNSPVSTSSPTFTVNTSLLDPGNYTIQLTVVTDQGQVATQQYPLTVDAGIQPADVVRELASAYESLQSAAFLKNFDPERFHNYAGFAAAIEDSFRNQLETMRVFQRPVNCAVVEAQDQAVCQAEFKLQFTEKNQPMQYLDAQGNPLPTGANPPAKAILGKAIQTGSEHDTIRFGRVDAGWKIVDYSVNVGCPNGASSTGINVGSCILAIGSSISPSFQITNLQLFSNEISLGSSVSGSFSVTPAGGFSSSVSFTGQGQIGNQPVTVQFTPGTSGPSGNVNFTVFAPANAPSGFNGPTPFTVVITGRDPTGSTTATANANLVLQPDFTLLVQPATSASSPAPVTQNSTLPVTVQIQSSTGFNGTVSIDFPNLPTGFSATGGNLAAGAQGSFPLTISSAAVPGPALITVRGTVSSGVVKTATLFVNVISDFTLSVTPSTSQANPALAPPGGSIQIAVQVVPISGFASTVTIDFPNLPPGFVASGGSVAAGATGQFTISNTLATSSTVYQLTVRGRFGTDTQLAPFFVQISSAATAKPAIHSIEPAYLSPGQVVNGKLYGVNLGAATTVQVAGSGIKAEILGSSPTELRVRFTIDPTANPGSRVLTVAAGANNVSATVNVNPPASSGAVSKLVQSRTAGTATSATTETTAGATTTSTSTATRAELVVSPQDFTMTPAQPKPGDTVSFHLVVRNVGAAPIQNADIDFLIAGTSIRQREQVNLEAGESASFDFEWKAKGVGRLEPRVVIDPENRNPQLTRDRKITSLQAFSLGDQPGTHLMAGTIVSAERGTPWRRGDLRLSVGGCTGFRVAAGSEQACGGSADFEVSSRGNGTQLVLEAEGVRNIRGTALDEANAASSGDLDASATLTPGSTYLVRSRRDIAMVRVVRVLGIESVRNAPPAALRGPRVSASERGWQQDSQPSTLTLVLEWKVLPRPSP